MAYGNTSDLDVAAAATDKWLNQGTNGIDLLSEHNPMLAIMMANSEQPGGDFAFRQGGPGDGNRFKFTVFGAANSTVAGISRANQINAISATVQSNVATNLWWDYTHYQGIVFMNYEDMAINSGESKMIELGDMYLAQIKAGFFDKVGDEMMDGSAGSRTRFQSFNAALLNTGTVGGIDQSDTANNAWWNAQGDSTAEVLQTYTIDKVRLACTHDTGLQTGIRKGHPDVGFMRNDLYAKFLQDLKPSQRTEVKSMIKGGAQYIEYAGVRFFNTDRLTAGQVLLLNSTTWAIRYKTKLPDPVTPGFVPVDRTPAMFQKGFNWWIGMGTTSCKHNGLLQNKTAS